MKKFAILTFIFAISLFAGVSFFKLQASVISDANVKVSNAKTSVYNHIEDLTNAWCDSNYYYVAANGEQIRYNKNTFQEVDRNSTITPPANNGQFYSAPFFHMFNIYQTGNPNPINTSPYLVPILGIQQFSSNLLILTSSGIDLMNMQGDVLDSFKATTFSQVEALENRIYNPVSIQVFESEIIVGDNFKNSVMVFSIANNKINFVSQPIAGLGTNAGRLFLPQSLALINENEYFVVDYSNRVSYINTQNNSSYFFGVAGKEDGQLSMPTLIAFDGENSLYIYDSENRIQQFTKSGQFVRAWKGIFSNVTSLQVDSYGNVWVLDVGNGKLFKNFVQHSAPAGLTVNSKMTISADCQDIYIEECQGIAADYMGNVYLLNDNGVSCTIEKKGGDKLELPAGEFVSFTINTLTGTIFLTSNLSTVKTINYPGFVETFDESSFVPFTESMVQIAKLNTNSVLFNYPYNIEKLQSLTENSKVIIIAQEGNYCYVIANGTYGYILTSQLINVSNNSAPYSEARVVYNNTKIYKHPTALVEISTVNINTKLSVVSDVPYTDHFGYSYLQVTGGYINIKSVINHALPPSTPTLKTNCYVNLYDGTSFIKVYDAGGNEIPFETLKNKHDIYVTTFNKNSTYTHIKYINEAGIEREGYILTIYVARNSISDLFLLATIITLAAIACAGILIFKSYSKKRRI